METCSKCPKCAAPADPSRDDGCTIFECGSLIGARGALAQNPHCVSAEAAFKRGLREGLAIAKANVTVSVTPQANGYYARTHWSDAEAEVERRCV